MLKKRLLTAAILIPLVLAAILFLTPLAFASVLAIFMGLAAWEWSFLSGLTHPVSRTGYALLIVGLFISSFLLPIPLLVIIVSLWWLIAFILLLLYPRASHLWAHSIGCRSLMGVLVLVPCALTLSILQSFSASFLIYCLVLIWLVDSIAYFVGRKWGRHKLAPQISPGKTVEGLFGGIFIAILMACFGVWFFSVPQSQWLAFFSIVIVGGGLITVFGDLFESMLKRAVDVKDSGSLFPGHGGILDRIDSMTTAIPFFTLMYAWLFFQN